MALASAPGSRPSLRSQLLVLLVSVVVLSLTVSMVTMLVMTWQLQKNQVTHTLETAARSAAIAVSAAVAFNDPKATAEALRILAPQSQIRAAGAYSWNGQRLARFGDETALPNVLDEMAVHGPDLTPLSRDTHLLVPIELDGSILGYLYLQANLADYRNAYLRQTTLAVLATLAALVLALWLGQRFIRRTTHPVLTLADVARRVRQGGDFRLRAPDTGGAGQEIEELVHGFNAMLAELEFRDRALAEHRRDLEARVEERTRALAASNEALTAEVQVRMATEARIRASEAQLMVQKQFADDANRAKSRFLAAASHDLRQPMHAMSLLISALNRQLESTITDRGGDGLSEVERLVSLVEDAVNNMGTLLNDLLDLSRLEAGVVVPDVECVSLQEVFDHLEARFQPAAMDQGLRLRFVPSALAVKTDPLLLKRILANLIENAIRYTPRGGVVVGVRRHGPEALCLEVVDSGAGIPEALYARVFEEYFQLGNPERTRQKGLGLGLSIVRRLAELLHLPLHMLSRIGFGTRFVLELPRCAAPVQARQAERLAEPEPLSEQGRLVLLIEDDEAIRTAACVLFDHWGIDLVAEPSLDAALATLAAREQRPDLVLSDYRLPGEYDGVGVVRQLRDRFGADLPGVLITGDTGEEAQRNITQSGLIILHKPLKPAKLRALIGHILG